MALYLLVTWARARCDTEKTDQGLYRRLSEPSSISSFHLQDNEKGTLSKDLTPTYYSFEDNNK